MEQDKNLAVSAEPEIKSTANSQGYNLIEFLCEGSHSIDLGWRKETDLDVVIESIRRKYLYIRFMDTRGGTEIGVNLIENKCDFTLAELEKGIDQIYVEGTLSLNFEKVICIADINLRTLKGFGKLKRLKKS